MNDTLSLAVYNPSRLSDENFLKGFVARQDLVEKFLSRLTEVTSSNRAQHHLILGQRGMGKTSMLRRLELGIKVDENLSKILLPITFREEQYNVHNLHALWLNCLDALADYYEKNGFVEKAKEVDLATSKVNKLKNDPEGTEALSEFLRLCKDANRRPILFIDNLDLILTGIKDQQWSFRRILQKNGGIVVVGASSNYLESVSDKEAAFYDFFQVTVLEKLSSLELTRCLAKLAKARGEEGKVVAAVIKDDPSRIRTLFNLTGGNPRTLTLLYMLLELDANGDVFRDLERLLDQVTALYKARVEDLSPQSRVVLDALALNWDPINASRLAEKANLQTSAVSSHLDRLVRDGLVEKVSISTSTRNAYQLSERFFNIWYLMRHAHRRQRAKLKWLTNFLRSFYNQHQLERKAQDFIDVNNQFTTKFADYCIALGDAIDNKSWRKLIGHEVLKAKGITLPVSDIDHAATVGVEKPETDEEWLSQGNLLLRLGRAPEAEDCYRKAVQLFPNSSLGWAVLGEHLMDTGNLEEAKVALEKSIKIEPEGNYAWWSIGNLLILMDSPPEKIIEAFKGVTDHEILSSAAWIKVGEIYLDDLDDYVSAENAFRKATLADTDCIEAYVNLGISLRRQEKFDEAEEVYLSATEIDPKNPHPWGVLGDLYSMLEDEEQESEEAYLKAIKLSSDWPNPRYALGRLILENGNRLEEAEELFESALAIDEGYLPALNKIGTLRLFRDNDVVRAKEAFERASELSPEHGPYLANLKLVELYSSSAEEISEEGTKYLLDQLCECGAAFVKALVALKNDDFGNAINEFQVGLEHDHAVTHSPHGALLTLFLREAQTRQFGRKLMSALEERGLDEKYWPVYTALDAFLLGEERLKDVNPEVRESAKLIYAWLAGTDMPGLG